MSEHDPLCHAAAVEGHDPECCDCALIARVRADERERIATAIDGMSRERYSVEGYWIKRVSDALDAAARIARSGGVATAANGGRDKDIDQLSHLIHEIDLHRPLDNAGKHGGLHTPTCGCEDR